MSTFSCEWAVVIGKLLLGPCVAYIKRAVEHEENWEERDVHRLPNLSFPYNIYIDHEQNKPKIICSKCGSNSTAILALSTTYLFYIRLLIQKVDCLGLCNKQFQSCHYRNITWKRNYCSNISEVLTVLHTTSQLTVRWSGVCPN